MKIKLEIEMDKPTAIKFLNLMEAVKSDFEIEDEEEMQLVISIIENLKGLIK